MAWGGGREGREGRDACCVLKHGLAVGATRMSRTKIMRRGAEGGGGGKTREG